MNRQPMHLRFHSCGRTADHCLGTNSGSVGCSNCAGNGVGNCANGCVSNNIGNCAGCVGKK